MLVREAMQEHVVTIPALESLPAAVVLMQTLNLKRLPVVHEGRLVGLLADRDVARHLPVFAGNLTPWEYVYRTGIVRVREVMCQPVLTTSPDVPLLNAVRMMLDRRVGGLPVVQDSKPVGMLTITDVLRAEVREPRLKWGTVRQHMTQTTVSVQVNAPASEGAATLKVTNLKVLPVLDGLRLVGVLHERDVRALVDRAQVAHGDTVLGDQFFMTGRTVRDLMRAPGGFVLGSVPMRDAMQGMLDANVRGLPVISDGGRLLGVVTISDVLRALLTLGEVEPA